MHVFFLPAGDLFKLSDGEILQDIYEIIPALKDIISDDTFVYNKSDHTLVDITITRLTSAIRQSGSKECNIRLILDLLDTCLSHTLTPNEKKQDPPHSKISAELLSCLFKENYDKTDLMKMCIPTAIKFLHKGNKELSKNIATYLWLAASANAFILAMNIQPVIDSLITGNYCLTRVLPLVYVFHPDPINDHIMVLASLLHGMDIVEKLALLDLLLRVAKTKPSLLESSISQIVDCLSIDQLVSLSLQVLLSFSYWKTLPLAAHFQRIYEAGLKSESIATTCFASQLIARIGLLSLDRARSALEFVSDQLSNADTVSSVSLLKEILNLVDAYPVLLSEKILNEVTRYSDRSSHESRQVVEQLRGLFISKKASDQTSFSACEIRQVSGNTTVSRGKVPSPSVHPAPPPSYTSQATSLPAGYVSVGGVAVPLSLIGSPSPTTPGNFGLPLGLPFSSGDGGNRGRVVGSKRDTSRSTPRLSTIGTTGMNRSLGRITGMHVSTSRLSPISGPSGNPGIYRSFGKLGPGPGTGNTPHLSIYSPSSGGPKTVRSRLMLDSLGPSSGGANPRLTEAGSMSIFSAPYTVTESTVPVAKVANITPTLSTSGSLAAIRDEKDNLTDFVHCSMLSSIQQSENQFRLSLASHGTVAPSTCNSHSVISILEPGSNNNKIQHENPFTAAYQLFEQNQENLQISSEASQNDKTNVAEPTSLESNASSTTWKGVIRRKRSGQGSLSRKLVRSAVSPETLTEIPTIQKQNSEGALNTDNVNQRISVFEPLNMRDTVQHFCEKHLDSIKSYMERVSAKIPLPVKCTIQERKSKKYVRVHFVCHKRGNCCLYANNFFFFETKHPRLWIHLMFLNLQARSDSALSTRDASVNALKTCWDILEHDNKSFVALVMSAFPSAKDQDNLFAELRSFRFFDVFEYNGISHHWGCFLCNHPDRAANFLLQQDSPVIEGDLKEKKSKWLLFRRWRTKHFSLNGSNLSCRERKKGQQSAKIEVHEVRSVKVARDRRSIPKAFEIFTDEKSITLKAKDKKDAEQWVQCLSIAVASVHARTETCYRSLPSQNVINTLAFSGYSSLRTVV